MKEKVIIFIDIETITEDEMQEGDAYESDEQLPPKDC